MEVKNTFDFELTTPFKYDTTVEAQVTAKRLTFMAPSNKQRAQCAKIKQLYNLALSDFQIKILTLTQDKPIQKREEAIQAEETEEEVTDSILQILFTAEKVNINDVFDLFKDLICGKRICFIDGREELTETKYDLMSYEDTEKCLGEYLSRFLLISQMKKTTKK